MVGDICNFKDAEVEDLFPIEFLAKIARKTLFKGTETDDEFDEIVEEDKPIVSQIQKFANTNNIKLEQGWKVELAKQAKTSIIKNKDFLRGSTKILGIWETLFKKIQTEDRG
jgi:hypothetical protein